ERRVNLHGQHESLAAALSMGAAYGCNAIRQQTDHGNALLSSYPILRYENEDISDHKMEQRGLLHAVVDVAGTPVHCLVVHLGLFAGGRSRQVTKLVDRIKRIVPDEEPILIAGDFNDWGNKLAPLFVDELGLYEVFAVAPDSPVLRPRRLISSVQKLGNSLFQLPSQKPVAARIHELGNNGAARTTPPPRTFPAAFPWFRLDRIYQRGFAVRNARVLQGVPWRQISDHAPL